MLIEILKELTKTEESTDVTIREVLAWAKRVEAQKAQSAILNSLNKRKDFDKVKAVSGGQRQIERNCKHMPKHHKSRVSIIVAPAIHPGDAWPMVRYLQSVARSSTIKWSAEV